MKVLVATALVIFLSSCTGTSDVGQAPVTGASSASQTSPAGGTDTPAGSGKRHSPCSDEPRPEPSQRTVLVFFACEDDLRHSPLSAHPFQRQVHGELTLARRVSTAFAAYFDGPTANEGKRYRTIGPPRTLISTTLKQRRVIVDLDLDAAGLTNTTGAQAILLQSHLRALAFQFRRVHSLQLQYHGSCEDFAVAMQSEGCFVLQRHTT
jgi:hypothetical protein